MTALPLTISTGDYDRVAALVDGRVPVEGCDVSYFLNSIEETSYRAFTHREFDVAEVSCSSYMVARSRGIDDYTAIPIFLSRMFRHSSIYIRDDAGISSPADLVGRTVGVPVYMMTAALWVRGILQEEYGIRPSQMEWRTGGLEEPGRYGKYPLNLPPDVKLEPIPNDRSLSDMLEKGEISVLISARAPSCFDRHAPHITRLFPDYQAEERAYYAKTKLFPIMHIVGVRRSLVEQHPWLPSSLYKAFLQAKQLCLQEQDDWAVAKVTTPWFMADRQRAVDLMGDDFWRYGFRQNLAELEVMTRWSYEQGLSVRPMKPEELFHPATLEQARV